MRKSSYTDDQIQAAIDMRKNGYTTVHIARVLDFTNPGAVQYYTSPGRKELRRKSTDKWYRKNRARDLKVMRDYQKTYKRKNANKSKPRT